MKPETEELLFKGDSLDMGNSAHRALVVGLVLIALVVLVLVAWAAIDPASYAGGVQPTIVAGQHVAP